VYTDVQDNAEAWQVRTQEKQKDFKPGLFGPAFFALFSQEKAKIVKNPVLFIPKQPYESLYW